MQQVQSFPWSIDLSEYGHKGCIFCRLQHGSAPWALAVQGGQPEWSHMEPRDPNDKSLVLEPINVWKSLSSNICFVRTSCHWLDTGYTGYQWLYYISNKFIHHSSSETISFQFWMPCQGSPRATIWEAPKQSCPLPGMIFVNGSLAKKGGLNTKKI